MIRTRTLAVIMIFATGFGSAARAEAPCFTAEAYEANAALRYHAMLRAAALTCGDLAAGEPILRDYQTFSTNNAGRLSSDQARLDRFYSDGEDASHLRETEMQNAQAVAESRAGTPAFCKAGVPALQSAVLDSAREVSAAIDEFAATHPGPVRRCR